MLEREQLDIAAICTATPEIDGPKAARQGIPSPFGSLVAGALVLLMSEVFLTSPRRGYQAGLTVATAVLAAVAAMLTNFCANERLPLGSAGVLDDQLT